MSYSEEDVIITKPELFEDDYIPPNIRARQSQMEEIRLCLLPMTKRRKPINVWLHGRPGTGKTTISRFVLKEMEEAGISGVYVNCWRCDSFFSVLEEVLRQLRVNFGDERDTRVKAEKFQRFVKDKPFLLVLDEIDLMPSKERNALLYNLCFGKVGLVCVGYSREALLNLEDRVKSRLAAQTVAFRPYGVPDLIEILKDRALFGLREGSWDMPLLEKIAQLAEGDARSAIQTLRCAAEFAEREGSERIETRHIMKGISSSVEMKRAYALKRLTEHHRILFDLVKTSPGIKSTDLWKAYLEKVAERGLEPIAKRTFCHYTSQMREQGLIRAERVKSKGKIYSFWVR